MTAHDGATSGSFRGACGVCQQTGLDMVWMHRERKYACILCVVTRCYADAARVVAEEAMRDPFNAEAYRALAVHLTKLAQEQLTGDKPPRAPLVPPRRGPW